MSFQCFVSFRVGLTISAREACIAFRRIFPSLVRSAVFELQLYDSEEAEADTPDFVGFVGRESRK